MDRARLAQYVHRTLQDLPKGAGWSFAERDEDGVTLTEGDYTDSIDDALRALGFVDVDGVPDETLLLESDFLTVAREVMGYALERLDNYYATVNDTMAGPLRVYRSQIKTAISQIRGTSTVGRKVTRQALTTTTIQGILQSDQF